MTIAETSLSAPSISAAAKWLVIKLTYVVLGGHAAAALAPALVNQREGDPDLVGIATFVAVFGTILLWPVPALLAWEGRNG